MFLVVCREIQRTILIQALLYVNLVLELSISNLTSKKTLTWNFFLQKNLSTLIDDHQATPNLYLDDKSNNPSIIKNTGHVNFKNHSFHNFRFVKVTSYPAVDQHVTAKHFGDETIYNSVDEPFLLSLDLNEKLIIKEQDSTFQNSSLTSLKN